MTAPKSVGEWADLLEARQAADEGTDELDLTAEQVWPRIQADLVVSLHLVHICERLLSMESTKRDLRRCLAVLEHGQ